LGGARLKDRIEAIPGLMIGEDEPLYQLTLSSREKSALWTRQQQKTGLSGKKQPLF
jgi:hypothetical protein